MAPDNRRSVRQPGFRTSGAVAAGLEVLRGEAVAGRRLLSMARRWAALRVGWRGLGLTAAEIRELADAGTPIGPRLDRGGRQVLQVCLPDHSDNLSGTRSVHLASR